MRPGNALLRGLWAAGAVALLTAVNLGAALGAPLALRDDPLFVNSSPAPLNMLVLSRDHRMYYEAYNDASDLDNDGVLDVNYKPAASFVYFGYFDSFRCYAYSSGVFVPKPGNANTDKKCGNSATYGWSGDWLNYVTTSRIDALRKVLYGGLRSTDTATNTVLQRAFIPQDAHSWGKEYTSVAENGYDIRDFTPLALPTANKRHLFANTTPSASTVTTGNTNPAINGVGLPLLRVLQNRNNRVWDWLSAERMVANNEIHQGAQTGAVTPTDYVVRVQVCVAGILEANCRSYSGGNAKPGGLLQDYGENDSMFFGLLSGSYGKPHDGGVLRKAVSSLKNEIDLTTGQFVYTLSPPGIINTIDRLRITNFNTDTYGCGWITDSSDAAGNCSMWGNPTAEMMFEVARYFSGKSTKTSTFNTSTANWEETSIGLSVADWNANTDPYRTSGGYAHCAKPFETVISDISPSYDSDSVPGSGFGSGFTSDLAMNASAIGQDIFDHEAASLGGTRFFIGESGAENDMAPTPKLVTSFGNIRGLSPEAPTKQGSYNSAAVAFHANTHDLNPAPGDQKLQTFAVALASPLPRIDIKVGNGKITMVPFAKSVGGNGISAEKGRYQPTNQIVDFYVDKLTETQGRFRVNFEDVEQGADHDMDAIAVYEYQVNAADGTVTITVTSEYAAGGIIQHMGYVISGSKTDGTYLVVRDLDTAAASDPDYFLDTPPGQPPGGIWNDHKELPAGVGSPSVRTFAPGNTVGAGLLKDPLFYAAKYGGFDDSRGTASGYPDTAAKWDENNDGVPDNYFLVTNALRLKQQLDQAFTSIIDRSGGASSASVNSGSINNDTHVFQATFDVRNWGGHLRSYSLDTTTANTREGDIGTMRWDAASLLPAPTARRIITVDPQVAAGSTGIYRTAKAFQWASLGSTLQTELDRGDSYGDERLAWLRGDQADESATRPANLRRRTSLLGDIVNSAPVFVGAPSSRYPNNLQGAAFNAFRNDNADRAKTIYVGANDGMLHAFDADSGRERWAFVPRSVFRNLYRLTSPSYSHRFYVDGTPAVIDAFYGNAWHTVLAGGLNKGGQGIYALDVTNPASVSESTPGNLFLWEFTDAQDADLGYTYSRPAIVRMHNGKFAAVFGNGYNNTDTDGGADTHVSTTGNAVLYVVDIATGALLQKIDTGVGKSADPTAQDRPNGLATPAVVDLDGDGVVDYVYAGDLFGNLWKFSVTDADATKWDVTYIQGSTKSPLFRAVNAAGVAQPITERPVVGPGPRGYGAVVLFGTGKFLESADRNVASLKTQSFYGIFDRMTGAASERVSRSELVQQTITAETSVATASGGTTSARTTSRNAVTTDKKGWYLDLVSPSGFQGEMQVTDPVLRNGRVLFTTLIPDPDPCAFGGRSWVMALDSFTGGRPATPAFDITRDGHFNAQDDYSGHAESYIVSRPGVVQGDENEHAIKSGSNATVETELYNSGPGSVGRQSWKQPR